MFAYESLRLACWLLLGAFLTAFAITIGGRLGMVYTLRFVCRDETERRMVLSATAIRSTGLEVWFGLSLVALLLAWPLLYAVSNASLHFALALMLSAWLLRSVGVGLRRYMTGSSWLAAFDCALALVGAAMASLLGVLFGNLFLGLPFRLANTTLAVYDGTILDLLHPFALVAGVLGLSLLAMHGASVTALKVEACPGMRARWVARICATAALLAFGICGIWLFWVPGNVIQSAIHPDLASSPLDKQVWPVAGAWLSHHGRNEWSLLLPAVAVLALLAVTVSPSRVAAFVASMLAIAGIVLSGGVALFPFLLPSSREPSHGLTVWDASASRGTLAVMLLVAAVLPLLMTICRVCAFALKRGTFWRAHHSKPKTAPHSDCSTGPVRTPVASLKPCE